jgi:hypothetical protein
MSTGSSIVEAIRGLTGLAKAAGSAGLFGSEGGTIARYAAAGLGLVADLVEAGLDPVVTIERVRAELLESELMGVDSSWQKKQDELFGKLPDIYEG